MNPNECDIMVARILTVDEFNERVVVQKYARDTERPVPTKDKNRRRERWTGGVGVDVCVCVCVCACVCMCVICHTLRN